MNLIAKEANVNREIRAPEVRVIDAEGKQLGILAVREALRVAEEQGLDLVEVAPGATPPVCRIMNYGKYKYQQSKRTQEARKHQTVIHVKEVKVRPRTEEHDFQFKLRHVKRFLSEGNKVKVSMLFRGREIAHPELLWLAASTNLQAALLVISELLGVFLILTRRFASTISRHPIDWALSLMAVNAPLLATPAPPSTFIALQITTALMIAGMIIQISAKAALWRSFGLVPANRGIKTGGPYRFLRHPMYAAAIIFMAGTSLLLGSWYGFFMGLIFVAGIAFRAVQEERVLKAELPGYDEYMAQVKYRFIPYVW